MNERRDERRRENEEKSERKHWRENGEERKKSKHTNFSVITSREEERVKNCNSNTLQPESASAERKMKQTHSEDHNRINEFIKLRDWQK